MKSLGAVVLISKGSPPASRMPSFTIFATSSRWLKQIEISDDEISEDLPEGLSLCLYRLTQEALHNAVRHAQARTVYVELRRFRDRLLLNVRDDGTGFDAESGCGLGLLGMEERLRQVGGALRIASRRGTGTTVSAEIPLASPESYAA